MFSVAQSTCLLIPLFNFTINMLPFAGFNSLHLRVSVEMRIQKKIYVDLNRPQNYKILYDFDYSNRIPLP